MKSLPLIVSLLVLCDFGSPRELHSAESPNIVLVMCDDLGWGDLGFNGGKTFALFNLIEDPAESTDLSSAKPEIHQAMIKTVTAWRESCKSSDAGEDYR